MVGAHDHQRAGKHTNDLEPVVGFEHDDIGTVAFCSCCCVAA